MDTTAVKVKDRLCSYRNGFGRIDTKDAGQDALQNHAHDNEDHYHKQYSHSGGQGLGLLANVQQQRRAMRTLSLQQVPIQIMRLVIRPGQEAWRARTDCYDTKIEKSLTYSLSPSIAERQNKCNYIFRHTYKCFCFTPRQPSRPVRLLRSPDCILHIRTIRRIRRDISLY